MNDVDGNAVFRHDDVAILSVEAIEAPEVVTSAWIDEQLAETYQRTGVRPGVLEDLAGISARRWWPSDVSFDEAGAMAGAAALESSGVDRDQIDMLISTSVCRDHLEPSVACAVHDRLELPASCLNFDVGNACLGFLNAMQIAAAAIDNSMARHVLIVDGEGSRYTQQATIARLQQPTATADDVHAELATLTLGSGAAAAVLGRHSEGPGRHRVVGGIARAGTAHHRLCVGDLDRMTTDTHGLLVAGSDLVEDAWKRAAEHFDWHAGIDAFIVHQVSRVHTTLMTQRLGIDPAKVPITFTDYGNIGPAAVPFTLAKHAATLAPGARVLCMGVGSGLNTAFTELIW